MRSGRTVLGMWLTGMLLVSCNLPSAPTSASVTASLPGRQELELIAASIVVHINLDREQIGLGPLVTSEALSDIAFHRSEDMITRSYFGHADRQDELPLVWPMLSASGYAGKLAENLYEYRGPLADVGAAAVGAWIASRDHRRLLLDARFHFTGVGLMGDGTLWRVTQVFAERGP